MTTKEKEKIQQLIKDINDTSSLLWEMDYGCDGVNDECCGYCGGRKISETDLENRLEQLIK